MAQTIIQMNEPELECPICGIEASALFTCKHREMPHCGDCHHDSLCSALSDLEELRGEEHGERSSYVPLDERFRQEHLE